MSTATTLSASEQAARKLTNIIYALYAAGVVTGGLTAIVALILNYVKKDEVAGTWLESHFRWQKQSFWYGTLGVIGGSIVVTIATMVATAIAVALGGGFIGTAIFFLASLLWLFPVGAAIWWIYRIVKGWLNLSSDKPM